MGYVLDAGQVRLLMPTTTFALMSALETSTLIRELSGTLLHQLAFCRELRALPLGGLQKRPAPDRWCVMEVVEHMNLSSGPYFRRLKALYGDPRSSVHPEGLFVPGRWGELAVKAMNPKADGTIGWRMRTMGMFEPRTATTKEWEALDQFEALLMTEQDLLVQAGQRGMGGARITSTLGPILRFKVGDAFRFPIAHQQRHLLQIERVLEVVQ